MMQDWRNFLGGARSKLVRIKEEKERTDGCDTAELKEEKERKKTVTDPLITRVPRGR